jgi:hypothetical protein
MQQGRVKVGRIAIPEDESSVLVLTRPRCDGRVGSSILGAASTFLQDRLSRFTDNKTWLHGYLRPELLGPM